MRRKILAITLIIFGLALSIYPVLRDYYYKFQQQKIMAIWQEDILRIGDGIENPTPTIETADLSDQQTREFLGLLLIDKINLKVPILTGVNEQNLNFGVAWIENTGKPGELGNFCVAGHRSRTYGLLFNRLNELEKGERLIIQTRDNEFVYLVTDRFIVNPENVEVLQGDGRKKRITLVTCDYSSKPYLRLIIQGELQS